jgi:hypothetical protein
MKFNIKYFNFKKLYIHFCFLALINIFFSTENVQAKTLNVNDIEISSSFEINFDKNKIIDKGFVEAFDRLILSIVQTKDQKKFKNPSLSLIKGLIETFSIKEEKFINEIYYLSLNVTFNKRKIFNLLESENIFPSNPVKQSIFFLPIIFDQNKNEISLFSESYLFNNWNSDLKKHHLLNYILPTEDIEDFSLIKLNSKNLEKYNFKKIIQKYDLENYIISIIFKNNNEIKVLNKINFNENEDIKNLSLNLDLNKNKDVDKLIIALKELYENYWKSKNEINTSVKLTLTTSVNNNNYLKISNFEKLMSNIDLVYDFYIYKFDNKNNFYKIIFNGSPDYFLKIMKNNNYEFDIQNQIWALK